MSDTVRLTAPIAVPAAIAVAVGVEEWLIGSIPSGYAAAVAVAKRLW